MRYITNTQLKEGMVLAEPLYGTKFEILHGKGMPLGAYHIQRICELGYQGVYIEDELSADIRVHDLIPPNLRIKTVKAAKKILQRAESGATPQGVFKITRERQQKITQPVIDALQSNPHRMIDKIDLKPNSDYSYYHAANVMILSLLIGIETGIPEKQLHELGLASLLHDVGNVFIPPEVFNKLGKITREEFALIKTHTQMSFNYLWNNFDISIDACNGALQHHENYNGTGYPGKLEKDQISLYARIISIADVYDALTSSRPFREPVFPPAAVDFMDTNAGAMFDPEILEIFKRVIALYPAGICVELDNGAHCIVYKNYREVPGRPRLRVIGTAGSEPQYVDLNFDAAYKSAKIVQIIES